MKNKNENIYCCNVCHEEYVGEKRLWVCPICGTADSFETINNSFDYGYYEDETEDFY